MTLTCPHILCPVRWMRGGSLCISPPRRTSHCPQRRRRCWVHPDMTQVCLIVSSLFSGLATSHLGGVDPGRDLEGRLLHQGGQDEREDHGQAHEEGGEDDLAHEPLLVPLGVVEPLDGERHDVFQHQLRPFNRGCYAQYSAHILNTHPRPWSRRCWGCCPWSARCRLYPARAPRNLEDPL